MTVGELLRVKLNEGMSKVEMADRLKISRQTLDHWLTGFSSPSPTNPETRSRLAELVGREEGYIFAVILVQRGIDPAEFAELATYAKGVWLSSPLSTAIVAA